MPRRGSLTRRNLKPASPAKDNRYVLYIRASTPEQVNSLDAQKTVATRFAERMGLDIDETFVGKGVSALRCDLRDRPEAVQMFRHMRRRGIANVLVLRVDRAFRSIHDFTLTLAWAEQQGFAFRFIDPDLDLSTPTGKLFIHLQVALAQMECEIRSARVDDALDSLRDNRLSRAGITAPYGWRAEPCADGTVTRKHGAKRGQYRHLAIPEEQAVLRHLQSLWEQHRATYGALTRIADAMNGLNIPTKMAGQPMRLHGRDIVCDGIWKPATVKSVLEHAVLATDAELPDGLPVLDQAIAILRSRAVRNPQSAPQLI